MGQVLNGAPKIQQGLRIRSQAGAEDTATGFDRWHSDHRWGLAVQPWAAVLSLHLCFLPWGMGLVSCLDPHLATGRWSWPPSLMWAEHSPSPPGRGQSTRATSECPGAQSCWLLAWSHAGRALECSRGHNRVVSSCPRYTGMARHPKDGGWRKTPPLLSPPPSHSRERQLHLWEFPQRPRLPTHQTVNLGAWHGLLSILPGAAAARGACPPSRRHSAMRHQLDTNMNWSGRANSGHPQRRLRAQTMQALWEILSGVLPSTKEPIGPFPAAPLVYLLQPIFSCSHVPLSLQKDPSRRDSRTPPQMDMWQVDSRAWELVRQPGSHLGTATLGLCDPGHVACPV